MTLNAKIKNASRCSVNNINFKSKLEKTAYIILSDKGFNPQYEPTTFEVYKSFVPITPFYDKETDAKYKKRIDTKDKKAYRMLIPKMAKIVGIRYTPDFYFNYKGIDVYIEIKGFENDVFYIKKKLFRKYLDELYLKTGQHSIFFEIYTKKQLLQALDIIKEYEQSISTNTTEYSMST